MLAYKPVFIAYFKIATELLHYIFSSSSGSFRDWHAFSVIPLYIYLQKYELIGREKHKRHDILHRRSNFNENHTFMTVYFTVFSLSRCWRTSLFIIIHHSLSLGIVSHQTSLYFCRVRAFQKRSQRLEKHHRKQCDINAQITTICYDTTWITRQACVADDRRRTSISGTTRKNARWGIGHNKIFRQRTKTLCLWACWTRSPLWL